MKPLTKKIEYYYDTDRYLSAFYKDDNVVFLDSSQYHKDFGRYSFLAIDPFLVLLYENDEVFENGIKISSSDIFETLKHHLTYFCLTPIDGLPPFQGGCAGFFSYDLCRKIESIAEDTIDDLQFPLVQLGFYDLVVAVDHTERSAWIISSGLPEQTQDKQKKRAEQRLSWCESKIKNNHYESMAQPVGLPSIDIKSTFNQKEYANAVRKTIQYIIDGDIFEANIAQRFHCETPDSFYPLDLYRQIRNRNPAPFSGYIRFGSVALVSSSPERFIKLTGSHIETRPIKGTCRRSSDCQEDAALANALLSSKKDRAENTMIVDLMRNDLSKVCCKNSILVSQYCGLETYETVHHLVSVVQGQLKECYGPVDLLRAVFPGGSISGAPKVRAMEIIEELEPVRRGPYCGSIGYIGFDGSMDTSIVIRTYAIKNKTLTYSAGGAVILDSDPISEYQESLLKAKVMRETIVGSKEFALSH